MRRRRLLIVAAITALVVLVGGRLAAEFVVDLLWYRSLGLDEVFWTRWSAGIMIRLVAALLTASFVFGNLWLVSRTLGSIRVRRRYGNIEIAERLPQSYIFGALITVSLLSGWWLSGGTGEPIAFLAALRPEAWGIADPVFGRDLSFYVFRYPLLNRLQTLAGVLLFWTLLLSAIAYVGTGSARWTESGPSVTPTVRRHLGLLAAALFAVLAWDLWLDRYELLMSGHGVGGVFGYTDVHARIPAKQLLAGLALVAGATVAWGAWQGSPRPPILGIGVLVLGFIGAQLIYPTVLQKLRVEPDEFAREAPYIEQNLRFTRHAYGLGELRREPLAYRGGRQPDAAQLQEQLAGVPLWDTRPVLQTYRALQALFPYYDFVSAHYDRYGAPGDVEQVTIAVRELDVTRLVAQTWQNLHLNYVRGAGAVVSPAAQMTAGGEPRFYISDLDPPRLASDAPGGLALREPSIYFGELTRGYVVLNPDPADLTGNPIVPLGVALDAGWKKLSFGWAFQSRNLLLSGELTPRSRIVYRRLVRDRAAAAAPFLLFPAGDRSAPHPVIYEGRIVWILDGYTASPHYPLAPLSRLGDRAVRYVRNSAKVTVDAVSGEVRVYALDPADPILRTYARIFPTLIEPIAQMPPELRRHLRFPADLFALQARVLQEYHLRDARAFYNREDVWAIPTETYRAAPIDFEPYYAIIALPGAETREFLLALPFVALGRQNMTALWVVRNDPPHYGEQILFELPRDELIPGPQQIESLIDQDPVISEQLALWKRGGSDVIRGHMVVLPVDSTLVFVEPLYLEAQESAIPQLERVILASGRRVVMRPTPQAALAALVGADAEERGGRLAARPDGAREPGAGAGEPIEAELVQARRLVEQAEAQLRAGDWAGFGQTWAELRGALRATAPRGQRAQ